MNVLVDTNVLLRSIQKRHPLCNAARKALVELCRFHTVCLTPQNVAEFWNVCTRPTDVNGLGLSISATDRHVDQMQKFAFILPESNQVFAIWRRIVVAYSVTGVKVHDARLVAAMAHHQIRHILTFNGADFSRYSEVEALRPEAIDQLDH